MRVEGGEVGGSSCGGWGSYTKEEFSDFFIAEVINGNKNQQITSE